MKSEALHKFASEIFSAIIISNSLMYCILLARSAICTMDLLVRLLAVTCWQIWQIGPGWFWQSSIISIFNFLVFEVWVDFKSGGAFSAQPWRPLQDTLEVILQSCQVLAGAGDWERERHPLEVSKHEGEGAFACICLSNCSALKSTFHWNHVFAYPETASILKQSQRESLFTSGPS